MDTPDWLQVLGHDQENGIGSSSPSDDMISCSRPFLQKRLRPHHDQALKCPRCDSTHTKFCYYNNYSLTQPRYFCKTCRRYWTKGGSLRNIPVGGGCRKNKKVSAKKPNDQRLTHHYPPDMSQTAETNLHLSFPNVQTSHLASLFNPSLMERNYHAMLDNPRQVDFMESKFNAMLGNSFKSHDFMGTKDGVLGSCLGDSTTHGCSTNFHGVCSSFGTPLDVGNNGVLMDTNQKFMLAFEGSEDSNQIELKPENNLLSFEWQDNGCSDAAKDSIGYLDSFGSWPPMINGHGSSPTNPLI